MKLTTTTWMLHRPLLLSSNPFRVFLTNIKKKAMTLAYHNSNSFIPRYMILVVWNLISSSIIFISRSQQCNKYDFMCRASWECKRMPEESITTATYFEITPISATTTRLPSRMSDIQWLSDRFIVIFGRPKTIIIVNTVPIISGDYNFWQLFVTTIQMGNLIFSLGRNYAMFF